MLSWETITDASQDCGCLLLAWTLFVLVFGGLTFLVLKMMGVL